MCIKIWLGDLGQYNAGNLVGEWLTLPMDEEELDAKVKQYSRNGEGDYFIADYETPDGISVKEFGGDVQKLNEIAETLAGLSDYDVKRVAWLAGERDLEFALDNYEDVTFYEGQRLNDVAWDMVDEGLFGDVPDNIKSYLDYDAIGRDLRHDGYEETSEGVFYYQG